MKKKQDEDRNSLEGVYRIPIYISDGEDHSYTEYVWGYANSRKEAKEIGIGIKNIMVAGDPVRIFEVGVPVHKEALIERLKNRTDEQTIRDMYDEIDKINRYRRKEGKEEINYPDIEEEKLDSDLYGKI